MAHMVFNLLSMHDTVLILLNLLDLTHRALTQQRGEGGQQ